ncbi:MAG TPA: class I SAM-dependent methyltransferase [Ilumatobacteraceae bacterium]|nr:class I SAM-dependent methyltransferase [Ilumatobacteraceae bacterium]
MSLDANANRFSGFADLYDRVRPVPPAVLADVITAYADRRVGLTVDLGCGTGLSTRWAAGWSTEVIGVEPSADMRARAAEVATAANVRYAAGWSSATDLPDSSADVVLAVQALHWMDPTPTFLEIARILRPGGVFAAIDCDWPPSVGNAIAEQAWHTARATLARHDRKALDDAGGDRLPSSSPQTDDLRPISSTDRAGAVTIADGVQFWHKNEHLGRMVASGQFEHCVEVAALGEEHGDADRFVQLFCSQGDYQAMRRRGFDDSTLGSTRSRQARMRRSG